MKLISEGRNVIISPEPLVNSIFFSDKLLLDKSLIAPVGIVSVYQSVVVKPEIVITTFPSRVHITSFSFISSFENIPPLSMIPV